LSYDQDEEEISVVVYFTDYQWHSKLQIIFQTIRVWHIPTIIQGFKASISVVWFYLLYGRALFLSVMT
jgi:hypothetical protein